MKIESNKLTPELEILATAFKEAGEPFVPEINANWTIGYTTVQATSYNGTRSSTAQAYLSPAKHRKNLYVIKHAHVNKVLFNEHIAIDVEFTYSLNYKTYTAKAFSNKEVIISAGAIQSPEILLRSGVGPKKDLQRLNIPLIADLPVGENFIDHVNAYMVYKFNPPTEPLSPNTSELDNIYDYVVHNTGKFASVPFLSAFIDTTNETGLPDILVFFGNYPAGTPVNSILTQNSYLDFENLNDPMIEANKHSALLTIGIALMLPKSRGNVKLCDGTECKQSIDINSNYLTHPDDKATLLRGLKYFWNIFNTEPFVNGSRNRIHTIPNFRM